MEGPCEEENKNSPTPSKKQPRDGAFELELGR